MKIQCIGNNVFICRTRQLKILFNCPLETKTLNKQQQEQQQQETRSDLSFILSRYFSEQGKRATDTQYSSVTNAINNCDEQTVFRIPDFRLIDIHTIDLVVIANSECMLGLPYLTEYMGYKGKIIATEPTIEFAKQRMEELVIYHSQNISCIDPGSSRYLTQLLPSSSIPEGWRSIYTLRDIESCIEKIQPVRYNESLLLFSTLRLVAHSSGYCLGSANWLLETSFKKIVFLSTTSNFNHLHPAPFDQTVLADADAVIVADVVEPSSNHISFDRAMTKLLAHTARTLRSNHNVLIASPSMNILFDLIGMIQTYLKSIGGKEIGPDRHDIPMYVASPIADKSLKYANICGEWMNLDRQSLLYEPHMPLPHGQLMKTGALKVIPSLDSTVKPEIRQPCIVFAGDPTCIHKGSIAWFMNQWKSSKDNTCLTIVPEAPITDEIKPRDSEMTCVHTPLDTRLKLEDIPSILRVKQPLKDTRYLLIPKMKGADLVKEELSNDLKTKVYIYTIGDIIHIDLKREWEEITLARSIIPTHRQVNGHHVSLYAPINGILNVYNNNLELHPDMSNLRDNGQGLRIQVELNTIIQQFKQNSIPIEIKSSQDGEITIELPSDLDSRVHIRQDSVTIVSDDERVRSLLKSIFIN
ncbi:hypothetical protein RMCBS344292_04591 [Rhizopus microsporus]|nr:hypothetical protein RMCBS344292_04591 [Rhizopus microsporus]